MTAKLGRVRQYLRQRTGRSEFTRGYRAGIAFALSLLPAEDADLTMFDLKGVRRELKDRS